MPIEPPLIMALQRVLPLDGSLLGSTQKSVGYVARSSPIVRKGPVHQNYIPYILRAGRFGARMPLRRGVSAHARDRCRRKSGGNRISQKGNWISKKEIFDFHRKSNFFRNPIFTFSERPAGALFRLTLHKFHE
jgi:hypothetical protein